MSVKSSGIARRLGIVCLALAMAASTGSALAQAQGAKGSLATARMLDARVNHADALRNALAARPGADVASTQAAGNQSQRVRPALASREASMPAIEIKMSPLTGGPASIVNRAGALSAPAAAGQSGASIVRAYLAQNADLFGLSDADLADIVVLGDSPGGTTGLRMIRVEQRIEGFPIFQSESRFLIDAQGRVVKVVGALVASPRLRLQASDAKATLIGAGEAVSRVLASTGVALAPTAFSVTGNNAGLLELVADDPAIKGPAAARQVLFPLAPGVLVAGWSVVVFTNGQEDWYSIVDAVTGDVLWRKNIRASASTQDARFRVYVQADGVTPADSPAPMSPTSATPGSGLQGTAIAPTIVNMSVAQNLAASPNGWIDDCPGGVCTANQTQTLGNNVLSCLDRTSGSGNVCDTDANNMLDGNGRPTGNPDANARNRDFLGTAPRDFETTFLPPPQGGNPEAGQTATGDGAAQITFRRAAVAQLFYISNWYHDRLFTLGFDEASGNFQQTNFSGMGLGNDRVLADAQDTTPPGVDNANFSTPPDGVSGRMQMYVFTGPTIDRDGSLDAEIVMHELTHGTSNRLVGNGAGLNWDPAGGMGEGWSDFVALSLLNNTNADDPDGQYASGGYATYKLAGLAYTDNYVYGIRRFPYSTDNTVNPLTWADVDDVTNNLSGGIAPTPVTFNLNGGHEVHNSGEVWALTLWEVRSRVIADPAGANGNVPTGNQTMLQLVIDAMKMTPIDPSFIDGRNALFDADCATHACANEASIWAGFADRGLGYGASAPVTHSFGYRAGHVGIKESFVVPRLDVVDAATDVTIDDAAANNNGAIDPGEPIRLTVKLTNPWRAAGKNVASATATLTTSTPGVTIYTGTASYGAIAAQGSATNAAPFLITVAPSVPCGSAIDFTLTTVSSLGTTSTTFQLRVGNGSGTAAPVTYSMATPVAIPDNRPRGVFQSINITDDFVIADLDFRLDSVTHTFIGDLTAMLRSPAGTGTDLVTAIGGLIAGGGAGDNLVNMLMDDDIANNAANDMVQAPNSAAPMTKSWKPVFNAPWGALAGFGSSDPVPNLSRFDGQSTKGSWSMLISDQAATDTGTLNGWSMIVTPKAFTCSPFAAAVLPAATKTVSGAFVVGGAVTYTVIITNNGTAAQPDNAGAEFTDTLPAGLTLVSATATSGTAATAANTVTWNGLLAPLGGSVTITITATVNAGTQGTTISNQGTVSYDSNNDGTNDASAMTDDPGVGGVSDPTSFVVGAASVAGTKTVAGTFAVGGTVTYTVVLSNSGGSASADNTGDEFTDVLPPTLTLVSANASSGTAVATVGTNTVTWNGAFPAGGNVTIIITATVNAGTGGQTISNQGTFHFDADVNGSNEATGTTDDPGAAGPNNPTSFVVDGGGTASASATKTVSGSFVRGGAITYTIVLTNTGTAAIADNPGNEFTDVLPASLTLVSATATSGTAVATVATRTVTWNGNIPVAGSVTITISATIGASAAGTINNQGAFTFDADLNGTNETTIQTDDPAVAGAGNATSFAVAAAPPPVAGPVAPIPTLSQMGLLLLMLTMIVLAGAYLRRG